MQPTRATKKSWLSVKCTRKGNGARMPQTQRREERIFKPSRRFPPTLACFTPHLLTTHQRNANTFEREISTVTDTGTTEGIEKSTNTGLDIEVKVETDPQPGRGGGKTKVKGSQRPSFAYDGENERQRDSSASLS